LAFSHSIVGFRLCCFNCGIAPFQTCSANLEHRRTSLASYSPQCIVPPTRLTNRSSQPLTGAMNRFDFMKQFLMFSTLAPASGG
jgi:hypothetical protein